MLRKQKPKTSGIKIPPRVIAVWGAAGINTAQLSYELSKELSAFCRVILTELPCLGIPRLGFLTGCKDREKHTEAALLELEKKGQLSGDYYYRVGENLALLSANIYTVPDYPATIKLEMETLIAFPEAFARYARSLGYSVIIYECQGQLTTPMTFFSLKLADTVIIPVDQTGEIAFSLLNIRRLVHVFRFSPQKFRIITREDPTLITPLLKIRDEEGKDLEGVSAGEAKITDLIRFFSEPADSESQLQSKNHCDQANDDRATIRL